MRAKWAPSTGSGARATMTTMEDAGTGRSDGSRRDIDVRRARGDVERAWTTRETRACETGEGWVRRRARAPRAEHGLVANAIDTAHVGAQVCVHSD